MSETFDADFYIPGVPEIKQGDSIRIQRNGKTWVFSVDEPIVPRFDWASGIPILKGYSLTGQAISE